MVPIHCTRQTSSSSTRSLPNPPAPDIPRSSSLNLWIHTSPHGSPSSTLTLFPPSDLSPSYAPCLSQNPVFYKPKQYQPALFPPKSQNLDFSVSSLHLKMMQDQASSFPSSSLPSSSERSSSSALQLEIKDGMESDEEIRRVPELGSEGAGPSISGREGGLDRVQATPGGGQKKRGRSPADKENKRLKRLLRNRVSAQQARERKKAYLSELEVKVKDLEKKNSELDERLSTLQNENQMLRHILKNTTVNRRGSSSANADV